MLQRLREAMGRGKNRNSFASLIFLDHHDTKMHLYKKLDCFLYISGNVNKEFNMFSSGIWLFFERKLDCTFSLHLNFCWGFLFYQTHFYICLLQIQLMQLYLLNKIGYETSTSANVHSKDIILYKYFTSPLSTFLFPTY